MLVSSYHGLQRILSTGLDTVAVFGNAVIGVFAPLPTPVEDAEVLFQVLVSVL